MTNDNEGPSLPKLLEPSPTSAARKPRGRPPGSKNKPRPPVVVTRESEAALRPVVLEVAAGCDVVAAVTAFARRRGVGVSVLCGRGAAAAVTLRLPTSPTTASTVTLHGRFEVLALSGTMMLQVPGGEAPPAFSVSLAGSGGQVIGGMVAGEMTAAEDGMVVVAATFGSAEVHRLPAEDEDGGPDDEQQEKPPHNRPQQQSILVAAAGAGGVGLGGGYSGVAAGLGAGGHVVSHCQQQQTHMVFWPHPPSTGEPVQPFSHF
ncbi:hypothetical protein PR202_ga08279 [Eleusine coracana subsp. coracana]|uniref:AT-hook motif nuclear-localized protein n=1 Tax=Eleusine coracana subsp. coracana TaxID=191504 RepID=A0AAV5BZL3_ELECO|nr:hypothetical protein QOZ80_1AG0046900 [Eleusine coracana subsp. coracana]GJM91861.1 hypothetical protein PR202_ga08279 [Eleusine coracana subsp. coracana]